MTAQRRPLLLASAGVTLLLPACLSFQTQPVPLTSPEHRQKIDAKPADLAKQARKELFAELPSRPGEAVPIRAGVSPATATQTSEKPSAVEPQPPTSPPAGVTVAGDPPGPFILPTLHPPPPAEPPLVAIVRAHLEGRTDRAMQVLQTLDPANQEFILAVLPAFARGATADLAADPIATALVADQLRSAASRLAPRSALMVENFALCRSRVYGYGRFEPWPQGQPYRPNDQALLYLEVRNLVSQPANGPRGETHLTYVRGTVEIRDAHGRLVEQPDPQDWQRRVPVVRFEHKEFSRGQLDDFHILYRFVVPVNPGVYTVSVELRDPAGRRSVKTTPIRFDVAGP